ncbi:MAG TPA: hypothetical protein VD860_08630 [Azospirillum sp.]|nr:hypothetical protein [Azospirillum sp.]
MSRISAAAQAAIAAQALASRPRLLADIAAVVRSRGGRLTAEQVDVVGVILARITPPDDLGAALAEWLADVGGDPELGVAWLASADGQFARIAAAVGDALDYSVADTLVVFGVTAEEAERLGLETLISEGQRADRRRRAQGIPTAAERRAAEQAQPKPWDNGGYSRATHYRRLEAERVQADAEAVAAVLRAAGVPVDPPERTPRPWEKLGYSRATYYRKLERGEIVVGAGETECETSRDHIKRGYDSCFDPSLILNNYTVARSLTSCLTPGTHPPVSVWPTEAARRLAVLAAELGLRFDPDATPHSPATAWEIPEDVTLSAESAAALQAAQAQAEEGERRRRGVESARARAADAERRADETAELRALCDALDPNGVLAPAERWERAVSARDAARRAAEADAALGEAYACPKRVTPAVWEAVPYAMRPRVRRLAGRFFAHGHTPNAAVALGVEAARREAAIANRLHADHGVAPEDAVALAREHYRLPTADAVDRALASLSAREVARAAAEAAIGEALAVAEPPILAAELAAVREGAVRILAGNPERSDPAHAVELARRCLDRDDG